MCFKNKSTIKSFVVDHNGNPIHVGDKVKCHNRANAIDHTVTKILKNGYIEVNEKRNKYPRNPNNYVTTKVIEGKSGNIAYSSITAYESDNPNPHAYDRFGNEILPGMIVKSNQGKTEKGFHKVLQIDSDGRFTAEDDTDRVKPRWSRRYEIVDFGPYSPTADTDTDNQGITDEDAEKIIEALTPLLKPLMNSFAKAIADIITA